MRCVYADQRKIQKIGSFVKFELVGCEFWHYKIRVNCWYAVKKFKHKLLFLLLFFFFQFQDYFSSYETGQSVGGAKTGEPREKPPDTPASRTWLVSHVARAGLEPTPDTAVR